MAFDCFCRRSDSGACSQASERSGCSRSPRRCACPRGDWVCGSHFAALFWPARSTSRGTIPQTLSHYSILAGGLRGAADKGMEPTYWWDALDNDVLQWLNDACRPRTRRSPSRPSTTLACCGTGADCARTNVNADTAPCKWYVLQNRPAMFTRIDRYLMTREKPAYVKYAGRRRSGQAVARDLDVPLISVFSVRTIPARAPPDRALTYASFRHRIGSIR